METYEWTWKSSDGLEMFSRGWAPEKKPRAVLVLTHGLGEHCGRYAHVGAALAGKGYALLGFDLRGHGKSGGPRGHAPAFESFMDDIDGMFAQSAARYPGVPRVLYGHSLGGILALNYVLRRKPALAGAVVTAPGLRTALELQAAKVFLAKALGTLLPKAGLPSGLETRLLSRDAQVVERYVSDPLVHDRISFGMAKSSIEAIAWAFEHASEFAVPLLLMHGTDDGIAYARGSREFADNVPGDCTLKLWEGLYHEIHNEPEKEEVLAFLLDWLEKQIPG